MNKYVLLLITLMCCCESKVELAVDQCLRQKLFQDCLSSVPMGPTHTVTNDWAEVISECANNAYHTSLRYPSQIKSECLAKRW